jgi:hypothetical protein
MANEMKPTKKNSPAIHHGANRYNKPASDYAPPHTMSDGKVDYGYRDGTNPGFGKNRSKLETADVSVGQYSISAGDEPIKTDGITMRGHGAAIKGIKSRGPMA